MIILNNSITIKPPAFSDIKTNKVINPDPITLDKLSVIYIDNEENKLLLAQIKNIPSNIILYQNQDYDNLGDWTRSQAESRLLEIIGPNVESYLQSLFPATLEQDPDGPGSILTDMIKTLGISSSPNCACRRHAIEMNQKGVDWCDNNIGTIMGWLQEEASKRHLPFVEIVAKAIVQRAIAKSRRIQKQKQKLNEQ